MAAITTRNELGATASEADTKTAIEAYIDAIYAAANASYTPGAIVMILDLRIAADDGDLNTFEYRMRVTVRASAYGTLKTNLAELLDEFGDMVTLSGDIDEIDAILGTVTLTLTYT